MNDVLNDITQSLFGKSSIRDCSIEELRTFTEKYPYFSTGHFLLTKRAYEQDQYAGTDQFTQCSIYFNDPLLVSFLLSVNTKEKKRIDPMNNEEQASLNAQQEEEYYNDEIVFSNISKSEETHADEKIKQQLIRESQDAEKKETEVSFEPFHTVDYFASQGIKTILEEKPKDRFGQQLKSFTDWLRTMKRLPETELVSAVTVVAEEKVMSMAEHSIENREVVTESMAEVWIKQGQPEKAIEIYQKLSLHNPSKSGYFAGLIENLKKTT